MPRIERLRFAPAPTGDLHVGGARAALFNWLYARKTGGNFLLRIEDTDAERSSDRFLESILGSLRWLGLSWDEEPVFQSKRRELYTAAAEKLLVSGSAYRCFCTPEKLEANRERARIEKLEYHYTGTCRSLTQEDIESRLAAGIPFTVRFRVPEGGTSFDDLVHGHTSFVNETIGDFIIARADGSPMYLLGVAVDDADMGITIVMRGDDHISNTPKQIMLMSALGSEIPRFAHLPQVLGADKKKLSKRHGAASVLEYRNMGILAPALVNFLALLGWSPGDDREKMSIGELIHDFTIEGIQKKSGVFDVEKLEWLNGHYLSETPDDELLDLAAPYFIERGLVSDAFAGEDREYLLRVIHLLKERCRLLPEFAERGEYFFRDPETYEEKGVKKLFTPPGVVERLDRIADRFGTLAPFDLRTADESLRIYAGESGINAASLIHPVRLAVTGVTYGPGLFELLELIGKERVVRRLRSAAGYIRRIA
jgi:glutamyl-tRNA synthetase